MTSWKFVDVKGVSTRYQEMGEGSPVLLLHGGEMAQGGADTWPPEMMQVLAAGGHRVVALDRLSSGGTDDPQDEADFRMSKVVEHAASFMDVLGLQRATVAGQSRGAFVAAQIMHLYPRLAQKLIVINSASLSIRVPAEPVAGTLMGKIYNETMTGDVEKDARIMSVTQNHISPEWIASRRSSAESVQRQKSRATFAKVRDELFEEFEILKAQTLKRFMGGEHTKPTQIIWGVGDPTTTAREGFDLFEIMEPHVDQLRLTMINRSGHWPHREYPLEVGRLMRDFIVDCE